MENRFGEARKLVKDLYRHIIKRAEEIVIGGGFRKIFLEEAYDDLFNALIEQKVLEEIEEKKKIEKVGSR